MNREVLAEFNEIASMRKMTASSPAKGLKYKRISMRPVLIGGDVVMQFECFSETKVFHFNVPQNAAVQWVCDNADSYGQYVFYYEDSTVTLLVSDRRVTRRTAVGDNGKIAVGHDKKKDRLLQGYVPALAELGVITFDGRILKEKSDKYRQIDRFVRIVDQALNGIGDGFTLLDFGCGKSYLGFILYHYFTKVLGKRVNIIGCDLKRDVVEGCRQLAEKYGYDGMKFIAGDINEMSDSIKADAILSLHACDTATDITLLYAIKNKIKYIFSVPCCQKEINAQLTTGGDLDILFDSGIIKDRAAALLTDAVRVKALESRGYKTDILEFVEFAHSPKNLMIRAVLTHPNKRGSLDGVKQMLDKYNVKQTLIEALYNEET